MVTLSNYNTINISTIPKTYVEDFLTIKKGLNLGLHNEDKEVKEVVTAYFKAINAAIKKTNTNNTFKEKYKVDISTVVDYGKKISLQSYYGVLAEKLNKIPSEKQFYLDVLTEIYNNNIKVPVSLTNVLLYDERIVFNDIKLKQDVYTPKKPSKTTDITKLFKNIVSKDDLRPQLTGVYVDDEGYVGTDAHVLFWQKTNINRKNVGKIINIKNGGFIKGNKYPNFERVIPNYYHNSNLSTDSIDIMELYKQVKCFVKFFNRTKWIYVQIKTLKHSFYFDTYKLLKLLEVHLKTGAKTFVLYYDASEPKKAKIFVDNLNNLSLIMPSYNSYDNEKIKLLKLNIPLNKEDILKQKKGLKLSITNLNEHPIKTIKNKKENTPKNNLVFSKIKERLNNSIEQKQTPKTTETNKTNNDTPTQSNGNLPSGWTKATEKPKEDTQNIFYLKGEVGKWLQKLQRYRLMLLVHGESGAGKSELVKQLANAFLDNDLKGGFFDLEQGGLVSKDTQDSIARNIPKHNQERLFFTDQAEKGLESIKAAAKHFDFIVVDSWQKLNTPMKHLDELRIEHPNTIWIVITQETVDGKAKGGSQTTFDPPIRIKAYKVDNTFVNNYAEIMKNRGNQNTVGTHFNMYTKTVVNANSNDNNNVTPTVGNGKKVTISLI